MTADEKLDRILDRVNAISVVVGRIDRELYQLRADVQLIRNEVQRHGQVIAPAIGCAGVGGCHGR